MIGCGCDGRCDLEHPCLACRNRQDMIERHRLRDALLEWNLRRQLRERRTPQATDVSNEAKEK